MRLFPILGLALFLSLAPLHVVAEETSGDTEKDAVYAAAAESAAREDEALIAELELLELLGLLENMNALASMEDTE